jgi:hypothetical protein
LCDNRWRERLNRHLVAFAVVSKHCLRSDWEWKAKDNELRRDFPAKNNIQAPSYLILVLSCRSTHRN